MDFVSQSMELEYFGQNCKEVFNSGKKKPEKMRISDC